VRASRNVIYLVAALHSYVRSEAMQATAAVEPQSWILKERN